MMRLVEMTAGATFPLRLRVVAVISLLTWLSVAACGRLIAYF
ncbi:MAG: hypothetical protein ABWZ74_04690 [Hyphomicrobiaceae bacterium]|jgi:hypothetical protein